MVRCRDEVSSWLVGLLLNKGNDGHSIVLHHESCRLKAHGKSKAELVPNEVPREQASICQVMGLSTCAG